MICIADMIAVWLAEVYLPLDQIFSELIAKHLKSSKYDSNFQTKISFYLSETTLWLSLL